MVKCTGFPLDLENLENKSTPGKPGKIMEFFQSGKVGTLNVGYDAFAVNDRRRPYTFHVSWFPPSEFLDPLRFLALGLVFCRVAVG